MPEICSQAVWSDLYLKLSEVFVRIQHYVFFVVLAEFKKIFPPATAPGIKQALVGYYGAGFSDKNFAAIDVEKAKTVHALFTSVDLKFQRLPVLFPRLRADIPIKHRLFVYSSHVGKICYVFIRLGLDIRHRLCGLVFFVRIYDLLAKLYVHTF